MGGGSRLAPAAPSVVGEELGHQVFRPPSSKPPSLSDLGQKNPVPPASRPERALEVGVGVGTMPRVAEDTQGAGRPASHSMRPVTSLGLGVGPVGETEGLLVWIPPCSS